MILLGGVNSEMLNPWEYVIDWLQICSVKNVAHGYKPQIHLLDCGLFTFSTICPHLSCSVQLPLYHHLFYKLCSNKSSAKFSPNTKFWVGDPTLRRTKRKTMLRCLPCKLRSKIISLSQVFAVCLEAQSIDLSWVLTLHFSRLFILATHMKSGPSLNRTFSQRPHSNSAASH